MKLPEKWQKIVEQNDEYVVQQVIGKNGGFQTRRRHREVHFTFLHNQKKDKNQFKNKNQPEIPENQAARKSNNQEFKEATFIQVRRGRVMGTQCGTAT